MDDVKIEVDGSVSIESASIMSSQGADIFVGGTKGVFRIGHKLSDTIPEFYNAL